MEFQQIYKEYHPKILGYLTRLTGKKIEAEDLTQEVFIKVHEALPGFKGRSSLSTWIYKIATNTANDNFKSASFQKGSKQTIPQEYLNENTENRNVWTGEKEKTSDKVLESNEMNCCIKRYVEELNENYRTVFILSEYEGKSNNEIAGILGVSLETVKIRISRARKQLKKMMEKGCEISSEEGSLKCNEI
jgi:RNA polymerase sigma-70 factor (ECF subfamily)